MKNLPDARLREVALAIVEGRAWTTQHVPQDLWRLVFIPLFFSTRVQLRGVRMAVGIVGEDKTTGQAINGFPLFFSCQLLNAHDTRQVVGYVERFTKARHELLAPTKRRRAR